MAPLGSDTDMDLVLRRPAFDPVRTCPACLLDVPLEMKPDPNLTTEEVLNFFSKQVPKVRAGLRSNRAATMQQLPMDPDALQKKLKCLNVDDRPSPSATDTITRWLSSGARARPRPSGSGGAGGSRPGSTHGLGSPSSPQSEPDTSTAGPASPSSPLEASDKGAEKKAGDVVRDLLPPPSSTYPRSPDCRIHLVPASGSIEDRVAVGLKGAECGGASANAGPPSPSGGTFQNGSLSPNGGSSADAGPSPNCGPFSNGGPSRSKAPFPNGAPSPSKGLFQHGGPSKAGGLKTARVVFPKVLLGDEDGLARALEAAEDGDVIALLPGEHVLQMDQLWQTDTDPTSISKDVEVVGLGAQGAVVVRGYDDVGRYRGVEEGPGSRGVFRTPLTGHWLQVVRAHVRFCNITFDQQLMHDTEELLRVVHGAVEVDGCHLVGVQQGVVVGAGSSAVVRGTTVEGCRGAAVVVDWCAVAVALVGNELKGNCTDQIPPVPLDSPSCREARPPPEAVVCLERSGHPAWERSTGSEADADFHVQLAMAENWIHGNGGPALGAQVVQEAITELHHLPGCGLLQSVFDIRPRPSEIQKRTLSAQRVGRAIQRRIMIGPGNVWCGNRGGGKGSHEEVEEEGQGEEEEKQLQEEQGELEQEGQEEEEGEEREKEEEKNEDEEGQSWQQEEEEDGRQAAQQGADKKDEVGRCDGEGGADEEGERKEAEERKESQDGKEKGVLFMQLLGGGGGVYSRVSYRDEVSIPAPAAGDLEVASTRCPNHQLAYKSFATRRHSILFTCEVDPETSKDGVCVGGYLAAPVTFVTNRSSIWNSRSQCPFCLEAGMCPQVRRIVRRSPECAALFGELANSELVVNICEGGHLYGLISRGPNFDEQD